MTERDPNLNREQTELLPVEEDTQDSAPASKSEKNLGKSMLM